MPPHKSINSKGKNGKLKRKRYFGYHLNQVIRVTSISNGTRRKLSPETTCTWWESDNEDA